MNGTLGRDKIWNDQIWNDIDKAVRDEVGRIRVAQKVFPSTILQNVQAVAVNTLTTGPLRLDDGFQPFIEMSVAFVLTQVQVENEESMHLARALAKLAGRTVAAAEDKFLFTATAGKFSSPGVDITNQSAVPDGIVQQASGTSEPAKTNIFTALAKGIGDLNGKNQPGPYALFLSPSRYASTYQPITTGSLVTNAERIIPLVPGGFYAVNSLSDDVGILVSLGGEPTTIYLGIEATTAFAYVDEKGAYKFRVFERIQLVVRDSTAFVTLDFTK